MDKGDSIKESGTRQKRKSAGNEVRVTRRTALQAAGAGALIGFGAQSVAANDVERTSVVEGDIASIEFSVSASEECLFTVGDADDSGYEVQLTIDPGTGGSMTLSMNTFYTAEDDPDKIFSLSGGTIEDTEIISGSSGFVLAPGEYMLDLSRDGSALARNRLEILPREEPEEITVWTAPNDTSIDDSSTFSGGISGSPFTQRNAIAIGDTTERSDTISPDDAYGDWLVIEVSATGIFGLLEGESYGSVDEMVVDEFFDLIVENTSNLELTQESLDIMSLYYDESAELLYAVADTDDLTVAGGDYLSETVGETYNVQFVLTEKFTELFDTAEESVGTRFDLIDREFEFVGANGTLEIEGESNETLPAETTVAPGTDIEFEADDGMLVLEQTETAVNSDGTVDVVFDFSNAEEGEDIVIQAFDQGFENNAETVAALSETQEEPGELVIRDWGPREQTTEPGDREFVEAYVENTGQTELTGSVEVIVDGIAVGGEEITIDGENSTVIPLEFTVPDQPGEYEWYLQTQDDETASHVLIVDGESHDDEEDEEDDEPGEAVFEILHVEPTVDTATVDETVHVDVVVANTGDDVGETELLIAFNSDVEQEFISLEPGEDEYITVPFQPSTEGEYEIYVETADDAVVADQIVMVEPAEDEEDTVDDTDDEVGAGAGGETDEDPSEQEEADDSGEQEDTAGDDTDSQATATEDDDDDGLFSEGLLLAGGGVAAAAAAAGYAVKKRGLGGFGGSDESDGGPQDGGRPGQGVQNQHPPQPPAGGRPTQSQPPQQPPGQHTQQPPQQPPGQHTQQPPQQPPGQHTQQPPQQQPQQPPRQQQPPHPNQQPPAHDQQPTPQQAPEGHGQPEGYQQSPPPAQPPEEQPGSPQEQHNQYPDEYEQWRPPEGEPESQTPPASQSRPAEHSQEPGQEPAQPPADETHQSDHRSPEENDNTERQ